MLEQSPADGWQISNGNMAKIIPGKWHIFPFILQMDNSENTVLNLLKVYFDILNVGKMETTDKTKKMQMWFFFRSFSQNVLTYLLIFFLYTICNYFKTTFKNKYIIFWLFIIVINICKKHLIDFITEYFYCFYISSEKFNK